MSGATDMTFDEWMSAHGRESIDHGLGTSELMEGAFEAGAKSNRRAVRESALAPPAGEEPEAFKSFCEDELGVAVDDVIGCDRDDVLAAFRAGRRLAEGGVSRLQAEIERLNTVITQQKTVLVSLRADLTESISIDSAQSAPATYEQDRRLEALAKSIYSTCFSDLPGFVPWVDGGNSVMQGKARDKARKQLNAATDGQAYSGVPGTSGQRLNQLANEGE